MPWAHAGAQGAVDHLVAIANRSPLRRCAFVADGRLTRYGRDRDLNGRRAQRVQVAFDVGALAGVELLLAALEVLLERGDGFTVTLELHRRDAQIAQHLPRR